MCQRSSCGKRAGTNYLFFSRIPLISIDFIHSFALSCLFVILISLPFHFSYHLDGIVKNFEVLKTDDLPRVSKFDPHVSGCKQNECMYIARWINFNSTKRFCEYLICLDCLCRSSRILQRIFYRFCVRTVPKRVTPTGSARPPMM